MQDPHDRAGLRAITPRTRARRLKWTPLRRHALTALALAAALCLTTACGTARPKPAPNDYSGQAKYSYDKAFDHYESGEYAESLKVFNFVRTKFPYSKYAALSSLRIADTYFAQEQHPSAIEAYRRFIQLHPTHPDVPYAYYKVGISYYQQLPGDWWILPPAYEKDLASTDEALTALKRFLDLYPNSQFAEEIAEKLAIVRQRLADHEFYVATYYLQRDQPRAAAMRLEFLLKTYPGAGFDQDGLFLLGKSYLLLKDVPKAVNIWQRLIDEYPGHALSQQASAYIQTHRLNEAVATPAPQDAPPDPSTVKGKTTEADDTQLPDLDSAPLQLTPPSLGE